MVTYSLTSHLGGKYQNGETTEYRDLMRLKLTQSYSFEGTRRDLLTLVDANHPWSDVILESDTWLHPKLKLTLDSRYNVHDERISSVDPGVEFDDKRGNVVGVSYRMSRNELEYLEGRLSTNVFRPWTFGYTTRYSFDRPGHSRVGLLRRVPAEVLGHQRRTRRPPRPHGLSLQLHPGRIDDRRQQISSWD